MSNSIFYKSIDAVMKKLSRCEIIVDDEFDYKPYRCLNLATSVCSKCNKQVCYYHNNKVHEDDKETIL